MTFHGVGMDFFWNYTSRTHEISLSVIIIIILRYSVLQCFVQGHENKVKPCFALLY